MDKPENKAKHLRRNLLWPPGRYRQRTCREQYCRIADDINQKQKRNNIILIGDFNAKLQIEKDGCSQQTSRNGNMLQELINHTDMTVVNQLPKHEGAWTRIHTQNKLNNKQKSIIDYILILTLIKI